MNGLREKLTLDRRHLIEAKMNLRECKDQILINKENFNKCQNDKDVEMRHLRLKLEKTEYLHPISNTGEIYII